MTTLTLVDTDILIDVGHGVQEAIDILKNIQSHHALAISVITQLELMIGCRNKS